MPGRPAGCGFSYLDDSGHGGVFLFGYVGPLPPNAPTIVIAVFFVVSANILDRSSMEILRVDLRRFFEYLNA